MKRAPYRIANFTKFLGLLIVAVGLSLQTATPLHAQPPVETFIAQIFGPKDAPSYELTAHFRGSFLLTTGSRPTGGTAVGLFWEWRKPGESKHWRLTVQELDLPWFLRPFSGAVRAAIEKRAEAPSQAFENFRDHDVFILEEQAGGRYVLVGLRRDLVDETIARFGKPADKEDEATRRMIARWLFTSPSMQSWITRPGAPYALKLLVDEPGVIHEMQVFYGWGQVSMTFTYVRVDGQLAWQEVRSTFEGSSVKGVGHLQGEVRLGFADYRLDRSPRWPQVAAKPQYEGSTVQQNGLGNESTSTDESTP